MNYEELYKIKEAELQKQVEQMNQLEQQRNELANMIVEGRGALKLLLELKEKDTKKK